MTAVQYSADLTVSSMSVQTAGSSSGITHHIPSSSSSGEATPILRPPKKRKINLTTDDGIDQCTKECQKTQFSEISPPLPRSADLKEWKGQRVLARSLTDSVYRPGVIRSISSSNDVIGIQFDGQEEITQTSADNVISDNAPSSSGIFVGMRVCVRIDSEWVEYRLGVVRERVLQPPIAKFLIELDAFDGSNAASRIWLSRASLRLLQVHLLGCTVCFSGRYFMFDSLCNYAVSNCISDASVLASRI